MSSTLSPILQQKWTSLLAGEQVIVSDTDLDTLQAHFDDDIAQYALVSIINPNQCGLLDRYIAYFKRPPHLRRQSNAHSKEKP